MQKKSVAIYHRSIPNAKNPEKVEFFKNFAQGVRAFGDICIDKEDYSYLSSDVGVILGWLHEGNKKGIHLQLRNTVITNQIARKKYVLVADSNLFLYANTNNPLHYLRYSFNGVFPQTGIYCDNVVDPERWNKISRDLNIRLRDYRSTGNHILLCLQRNGGWSMGKKDVIEWACETAYKIRQNSDRPIVIRPHPGDLTPRAFLDPSSPQSRLKNLKNIIWSTNENFLSDLKHAWAVVNHNSSPAVGAAIEGIPVFVTDPDNSQARDVANIDIDKIENPELIDRQAWVQRISMFHWNFDELKSGECWRHMRKFVL